MYVPHWPLLEIQQTSLTSQPCKVQWQTDDFKILGLLLKRINSHQEESFFQIKPPYFTFCAGVSKMNPKVIIHLSKHHQCQSEIPIVNACRLCIFKKKLQGFCFTPRKVELYLRKWYTWKVNWYGRVRRGRSQDMAGVTLQSRCQCGHIQAGGWVSFCHLESTQYHRNRSRPGSKTE